ncbi:MAG: DUF4198 domain-containing protein [Chitinophagales bacterium]
MKKKIIFSLLLFFVIHVLGREFWIQPDKFIYKRTEPVNIKFLMGENFNGDNWTGDKDKINCLQLYFDDVADKNLDANFGNDPGDSLQLAMIDEGTVMIALNTKNSFVDLDAEKFNQYLKDNGLSDALEYREKNGDTVKNGHEQYQRSVKTIFQVGNNFTNIYNKKTDLPLDIIPLDHPYNVMKDGDFRLQVFFMGEKLKNTKIKIWHKLDDKVSVQDTATDEEGQVKFFLSPRGEWMVSCIKMIQLENDPQAEWQSYRGSLTWGYY